MVYFGAQNDPEIGPETDIQRTSKSSSNWHANPQTKTDAKPVERLEFLLILGPKVAQKLDLWSPYSPHI